MRHVPGNEIEDQEDLELEESSTPFEPLVVSTQAYLVGNERPYNPNDQSGIIERYINERQQAALANAKNARDNNEQQEQEDYERHLRNERQRSAAANVNNARDSNQQQEQEDYERYLRNERQRTAAANVNNTRDNNHQQQEDLVNIFFIK